MIAAIGTELSGHDVQRAAIVDAGIGVSWIFAMSPDMQINLNQQDQWGTNASEYEQSWDEE